MLTSIFIREETKVISKCSKTGGEWREGQWIEGQQALRDFYIYLSGHSILLCNSRVVSHGYFWWLKIPKESSWFKSVVAAEPWLSFRMLLRFWPIMSDYLIFIFSPLNLTPMLTVDCQWHWLHIISLLPIIWVLKPSRQKSEISHFYR